MANRFAGLTIRYNAHAMPDESVRDETGNSRIGPLAVL